MTKESSPATLREPGPRQVERPVVVFGVPALLALLSFVSALPGGFVLDDYHFLVDNSSVTGGVRLSLSRAITTDGGLFYRPLPVFIMSVEHAIWGLRPFGYHLVSVLLHAGTTLAVVALARRVSSNVAALWCGAVFAVHAVHVEAVAGIANRSEVMVTLFVVLAWSAFARGQDSGRRFDLRSFIALNAFALLAGLCKENAITLPLGLIALGLWRRPRRPLAALQCAPALIGAMALRHYAYVGVVGLPQIDIFAEAPHARWFTVLRGVATYAELLVAPTTQLASYAPPAYPFVESVTAGVVAGALIVVVVAAAILWGLRSPQPGSLGLALFVVTLSPYLHLVPFSVIVAERFLYLPSVGFCLAVGWVIVEASKRTERPALLVAAASLWVISLGALAANRNLDWHDPISLWSSDIEASGGSTLAHANLGASLWQVERYGEAITELRQAVDLEPWREQWVVSLAGMYRAVGMHEESAVVARLGLRHHPDSSLLRGLAHPTPRRDPPRNGDGAGDRAGDHAGDSAGDRTGDRTGDSAGDRAE